MATVLSTMMMMGMASTSTSTSTNTRSAQAVALSRNGSARLRVGVELLRSSPSASLPQSRPQAQSYPPPSTTTHQTHSQPQLHHLYTIPVPPTLTKTLYTIYIPTLSPAPYITASTPLADDFRAWGYRVDAYPRLHHNVLALVAMQDAEAYAREERREELLDFWTGEWLRREVGVERGRTRTRTRTMERTRERRGGWGLEMVGAWFGFGGVGRRGCESGMVGDGDEGGVEDWDGEVLPRYTKGEDPPAYEN